MLADSVLYTWRRLEGAKELPYQAGSAAAFQEPWLSIPALWQQAGADRQQNIADTGSREASSSAAGTAPTLASLCGTEPRALETLPPPCQG